MCIELPDPCALVGNKTKFPSAHYSYNKNKKKQQILNLMKNPSECIIKCVVEESFLISRDFVFFFFWFNECAKEIVVIVVAGAADNCCTLFCC